VVQSYRIAIVRGDDVEAGDEYNAEGQPEAAVGGEGGGTKGVPGCEFPHAGQELDETAVEQGETDDDIGGYNGRGTGIVDGKDKGGQSESAEAEGARVRNLCRGDLDVLEVFLVLFSHYVIYRGDLRKGMFLVLCP